MALNRHVSRLSKIIAEREKITFPEAEARLAALTLEIYVGPNASSNAAHTAVLTAVNLGCRSFLGGVKVTGFTDQPLRTSLPLPCGSLREAAAALGARDFVGPAGWKLVVGGEHEDGAISLWWDGWRGGACERPVQLRTGENPLSGIAAAALAVGMAFARAANLPFEDQSEVLLWPGDKAPAFSEVFLPGALWLIGLGNLGQAYLWALAALPFIDPAAVELVLQDADRVSEENWGTSVLVMGDTYGDLKTMVGERWGLAKGFRVRRIDRYLTAADRLADGDPAIALSGLDRVGPRKALGEVGFAVIVDAGLGRTAKDFSKYRVTAFDAEYSIAAHFAGQHDHLLDEGVECEHAYRDLEARLGRCGMAQVAGAAAAVPFVSALASALAVTRLIALASGQPFPVSEVADVHRPSAARRSILRSFAGRAISHAGRPQGAASPP